MLVARGPGLPSEPHADAPASTSEAAHDVRDPRPEWRSIGEPVALPNGLRGVALSPAADRARRAAARAETERDRLQRALDAERAAHTLTARRAATSEYGAAVLSATNAALLRRTAAIEESTAWRLTGPLRRFAEAHPGALHAAKRMARLAGRAAALRLPHGAEIGPEQHRAPPPPNAPAPAARALAPSDIELPGAASPLVSVIIPSFGKVDYTLRCLAAIATHPPDVPIEVIVIDDASRDIAVGGLAGIRHLRLIISETNRGFVGTCNEAARHARGEFLLLLNNDTQVLPGWLDPMVAIFRARPDAGAVGSKLVYPDGRLQEAGGIIWQDGSGTNVGNGDDPHKPEYNYVREVDYCSAASLLVRRDTFEALGGFSEAYAPAYYEDTDLAFRLRARGLQVIYQPRSCVVHWEGGTHGRKLQSGMKAFQAANQARFRNTWKGTLDRSHLKPGPAGILARDRLAGRRVVLVIDHLVPEPDRDAGSRNMASFTAAMQRAGMVVKFWPMNQSYSPHYTEALQKQGVEVIYGPDPTLFSSWIRANGESLDFVLLSRPTVAPNYLAELKLFSKAKLIYYGHDLHFERMHLQASVQKDVALGRAASDMERVERWVWRSADVVLHPSAEEAATVAAMEPGVVSLPVVPFAFNRFGAPRPPVRSPAILFVAGFSHPPNEDAALWFVREILPLIRAVSPQATLDIVGSHPTAAVRALAGNGVRVTGDVSDGELASFYETARVAVVPLRFGAGMKLKVVEALRDGVPLVTTPVGAQGLPGLAGVASVATEPRAIADAVCRLLTDDAAWSRASAGQIDYAKARFSEAALSESLMVAFDRARRR
ncbi:MAG: glycosyltransferase [Acetobacteraceae bacterium]|nr:glycosyltransferase [Acetobacteraceae bacterium]